MAGLYKNLIKCHFNYLISKTTLIVTSVLVFIITMVNFIFIFQYDNSILVNDNYNLYFNNSFFITKILIIIYAVFLFGYSFMARVDNYVIILIASNISRIKLFISKIIAIIVICFLLVYFAYFINFIIGIIFQKNYVFNIKFLKAYIYLLFIAVFYGLISLLLVSLSNNIYVLIIPFAIYNLSEIINSNNSNILSSFNLFFPYIGLNSNLYYGFFHLFILLTILITINLFIFSEKEYS